MDKITNTEWLDEVTFLVNFDDKEIINNGKPFMVSIIAEWHEDEKEWVYEREWYDMEGNYLDREDLDACMTPYEVAMYHTMAEGALTDFYRNNPSATPYEGDNNSTNTSWDDIVVADDYDKYDCLIDSIKDYYAKDDDDKAFEIEEMCNHAFNKLLHELDVKYKVN